MKVRRIEPKDIPRLRQIAKHYDFPFPDLTNPLYFACAVVEKGQGEIVGAGFLKHTAEAILMLDYDARKRDKLTAINDLIVTGQIISRKEGIENWHIFIKDNSSFEKVLIKRYGFTDCDGTALHLLLEK